MEQDIDRAFFDDYESTKKLRNEVNTEIGKNRLKIWSQLWEFYRHVNLVSLGMLGATQFFVGGIRVKEYSTIGIILYLITILFTLLMTRESLDSDAKKSQEFLDEQNDIFDEKLELMRKYISEGVITPEKYATYRNELLASPAATRVKEQVKQMATRKMDRTKDERFAGEFTLFFFASASFFMIIAFYGQINTLLVGCAIIALFMLTFLDSASFVISFISNILHSLSRLYKDK